MKSEKEIFKAGSKTYYNSSLFFPKKIRGDVFKFYSFVRVVDDYVDNKPQDLKSFNEIKNNLRNSKHKFTGVNKQAVDNIRYIEKKYKVPESYMNAFIDSMQMDVDKKQYQTIDDLLVYIYGSAEVIGLVMNKIVGVKPEADDYASMLGRSMQYINFIRDIDEDINLGREYIPKDVLSSHSLSKLSAKNKDNFSELIRSEIQRYQQWQNEAEKGFKFIPYRQRIAIKTASDMYKWTARQIYKDPTVVFAKKVKPTKTRIVLAALKNTLPLS